MGDRIINIIHTDGSILLTTVTLIWIGYFCDAGWTSVTITNLGKICRCPNTVQEDELGDVLEDNFEIHPGLKECFSKRCVCNYYHLITKDKELIASIQDNGALEKFVDIHREK